MKPRACSSILVTTALLLTQASFALAATTWYVNGVDGSDSHNCKSPLTACKTIGHAISLAASGDSVRVAAATYAEHLTIGTSLELIGAAAGSTIIDGSGTARVIMIPNAGSVVTLANVTIRNGYQLYGAGISNHGTLTIDSSTVSANEAFGDGDSYGGGIWNNVGRKLTINNSTLSDNIARCTNRYTACNAGGAGIYNNGGTVAINNSTIAGNSAGAAPLMNAPRSQGGAIYNSGILTISNSTVWANAAYRGSGIYGSAHLQNSIIAYNHSPSLAEGNCDGPVTSIFSLSSDNSCNLNGPGDLNNVNPKLGTFGNNGGPTQTISLLSGSPAIDAGNPSGCTDGLGYLLKTDQRGLPRPDTEDRSGCDMGAFEKQNLGPATHLSVSAPSTVQEAKPFKLTVTAHDAANNLVTGYAGTVHFSSNDTQAVLPGNSTLTSGMGVFSATLRSIGAHTITATDTVTASISGTSNPIDVPILCRTLGQSCSIVFKCCPGLSCNVINPPGGRFGTECEH